MSIKAHNVIHVSWTRPFVQQSEDFCELDDQTPVTPISTDTDGLPLYFVQEILAHFPRGKGYQWLKHLAGTPWHDAEWRPARDFVARDGNATDAFLKYVQAHNLLPELLSSGTIKDSCCWDDNIQEGQ